MMYIIYFKNQYNFYYRKPTTHKGKRAILKKEAKLIENVKQILCFKSKKTSQIVVDFMKDLVSSDNSKLFYIINMTIFDFSII